MRSVYIRPLHFVYGSDAKDQLKKKIAWPICGNTSIAFAAIEILNKKTNTISTICHGPIIPNNNTDVIILIVKLNMQIYAF